MIDLGNNKFIICSNCKHLIVYNDEDINVENSFVMMKYYIPQYDEMWKRIYNDPIEAIKNFHECKIATDEINSKRKIKDQIPYPDIDVVQGSKYIACPHCKSHVRL